MTCDKQGSDLESMVQKAVCFAKLVIAAVRCKADQIESASLCAVLADMKHTLRTVFDVLPEVRVLKRFFAEAESCRAITTALQKIHVPEEVLELMDTDNVHPVERWSSEDVLLFLQDEIEGRENQIRELVVRCMVYCSLLLKLARNRRDKLETCHCTRRLLDGRRKRSRSDSCASWPQCMFSAPPRHGRKKPRMGT